MRNNIWLAVTVLLLLVTSLTACSSAPAPTQDQGTTATSEPAVVNTPTSPATAAPQAEEQPTVAVNSAENAYPAPQVEIVPYNPYPDPIQGETIEWSQVEALLQNERISEVLQQYTSTMQVVITLEDGRIFLVVEPAKDDIFKLLDNCGQSCNNIRRKSEY